VSALGFKHLFVRILSGRHMFHENKSLHRPCFVKIYLQLPGDTVKTGKTMTAAHKPDVKELCEWNEMVHVPVTSLRQELHVRVYASLFLSKALLCEFVLSITDGLNLHLQDFVTPSGHLGDASSLLTDLSHFEDMESLKFKRPRQHPTGAFIGLDDEIIQDFNFSDCPWRSKKVQQHGPGIVTLGLKLS
jgi:predicted protein tyrosine phosphatase